MASIEELRARVDSLRAQIPRPPSEMTREEMAAEVDSFLIRRGVTFPNGDMRLPSYPPDWDRALAKVESR